MSIPGFDSAQHAYDNAGPDTDVCGGCEDEDCGACDGECCDSCYGNWGDHEEDPDDARDREYDNYDDED